MQFDAHQNYFIHVRASTQAHFETAMSLAFNGKYATGCGDYGDFGLVYFWFRSTLWVTEPPVLKSMNSHDEYVLHDPSEFTIFHSEKCVGEILSFSWEWVCEHPHTEKGEFGFDITNDPGYNSSDLLCIVRRTYEEYHYE